MARLLSFVATHIWSLVSRCHYITRICLSNFLLILPEIRNAEGNWCEINGHQIDFLADWLTESAQSKLKGLHTHFILTYSSGVSHWHDSALSQRSEWTFICSMLDYCMKIWVSYAHQQDRKKSFRCIDEIGPTNGHMVCRPSVAWNESFNFLHLQILVWVWVENSHGFTQESTKHFSIVHSWCRVTYYRRARGWADLLRLDAFRDKKTCIHDEFYNWRMSESPEYDGDFIKYLVDMVGTV